MQRVIMIIASCLLYCKAALNVVQKTCNGYCKMVPLNSRYVVI